MYTFVCVYIYENTILSYKWSTVVFEKLYFCQRIWKNKISILGNTCLKRRYTSTSKVHRENKNVSVSYINVSQTLHLNLSGAGIFSPSSIITPKFSMIPKVHFVVWTTASWAEHRLDSSQEIFVVILLYITNVLLPAELNTFACHWLS